MAPLNVPDAEYVLARRVLLDALAALEQHRDAIVLVGAQAVYLRVGEADLAVAPYTTDGDLAIDPADLQERPALEQLLNDAGFVRGNRDAIGSWTTTRRTGADRPIALGIDLLVPASANDAPGRRAARLPGHSANSARLVHGLDGALVDHDLLTLTALEPEDERQVEMRVAGPAALLVSKAHKIADRDGTSRLSDKDALDVLRLLRGTSTDDLAHRYARLLVDTRSRDVAAHAGELLETQFANRRGIGVEMATRAVGQLVDADEVAAALVSLTADLLAALDRRS